jgi:hypothetical protein
MEWRRGAQFPQGMTKIVVLPIDFLGQGALLEPADQKLHDMAVEYVSRELEHGKDLNLSKFNKVWVGMKDGDIVGVSGFVYKLDIPVLRATDAETLRFLAQRMNDYFADNGCRNHEVLIHISKRERPEQRCPEWAEVMKEWGAQSADRFSFKVR